MYLFRGKSDFWVYFQELIEQRKTFYAMNKSEKAFFLKGSSKFENVFGINN